MSTLLYITCNLKPADQSRSLTIGSLFLDEYLRHNPDDEIHFLDLYRDNIQRIDVDVLNGFKKIQNGDAYASLTQDEQRKIDRIWKHAEQFVSADKYVFVTPMFNLGFPAELKIYIDAVCVAGKTFTYSSTGPVGLLKGHGKKCLHIHSSGGFHYGNAEDYSVPYLKSVMSFMGVDDFEAVVAEGVDVIPEWANEIKNRAAAHALTIAGSY